MAKKRPSLLVAEEFPENGEFSGRRSDRVRALALSVAERLGFDVDLVHAEDLSSLARGGSAGKATRKKLIAEKLSGIRQRPNIANLPQVHVQVLDGSPAEAVLKLTRRAGRVRMIVMGTRGTSGVARILLGSVTEEVVRHSKIPVLILGPKAQELDRHQWTFDRILVGTDLSKGSQPGKRAEKQAESLAKKLHAELIFLHCISEGLHPVLQTAMASPSGASGLASLSAQIRKDVEKALKRRAASVRVGKNSVRGVRYLIDERNLAASTALLSAQSSLGADLIVVGTRARGLFAQSFLGSTSREVILNSSVPVLVVP